MNPRVHHLLELLDIDALHPSWIMIWIFPEYVVITDGSVVHFAEASHIINVFIILTSSLELCVVTFQFILNCCYVETFHKPFFISIIGYGGSYGEVTNGLIDE
jgi:hypothetical protein